MKPLLLAMAGNEAMVRVLATSLDADIGTLLQRSFPDGESYVQILSPVSGRDVIVVATLDRPDPKCLPLIFVADAVRDLGAKRVVLAAPYLGYLRQDRRFKEGEALTSATFAGLLSDHFNGLVTVDPHLHRYPSLDAVYRIPTRAVTAARLLAGWVRANVPDPFLIGPDGESEQWVSKVATGSDAPFVVLSKTRKGDRDVEITLPGIERLKGHTPVVVDDIISTARTMIKTAGLLQEAGLQAPVCLGVHGVFADRAYEDLVRSGVARIATCNTIPHITNAIDISGVVAGALRDLFLV